jgi:hypothetical protein
MSYYKKPMLAAVFDLQSRIKNIVSGDFLNEYAAGPSPKYLLDLTLKAACA